MSKDEILALAERVEALEGPNYATECAIHEVISKIVPSGFAMQYEGVRVPNYTVSIDSAMTLVPEGWWLAGLNFAPPDFRTAQDREWHAEFGGPITWATFDGMPEPQFNCEGGNASTPALALTAACLRAIASEHQPREADRDND